MEKEIDFSKIEGQKEPSEVSPEKKEKEEEKPIAWFKKDERGFHTFETGKFGVPDRFANKGIKIEEGKPYFVEVLKDTKPEEKRKGVHFLKVEPITWENTPSRFLSYHFDLETKELKLKNRLLEEERGFDPKDVEVKYQLEKETPYSLTISYQVFLKGKEIKKDRLWISDTDILFSPQPHEVEAISAIGKEDWVSQTKERFRKIEEEKRTKEKEREKEVEAEMSKFPLLKEIDQKDLALCFLNNPPFYYKKPELKQMDPLMPFGGISDHLISFKNYILRAVYHLDEDYADLKYLKINQKIIEEKDLKKWKPIISDIIKFSLNPPYIGRKASKVELPANLLETIFSGFQEEMAEIKKNLKISMEEKEWTTETIEGVEDSLRHFSASEPYKKAQEIVERQLEEKKEEAKKALEAFPKDWEIKGKWLEVNYKIKAEIESGYHTETEEHGLGTMVGEGRLVITTHGYARIKKEIEKPEVRIKMEGIPEELREKIKARILEYFEPYPKV